MKRLLAWVGVCFFFACCGAEAAQSERDGKGKVVLYSSMQGMYIEPIKKGFEARYPDIELEYFCSDTGRVLKRIEDERRAGQVKADILWLGDTVDYVFFKRDGILEKYSSPEAAAIDPKFIDPEGYYTGARIVNVGIAYNSDLVRPEEAPKTWKALLSPKWKNRLVITDPALAGTTKYFLTAIMNTPGYGPEYFEKLHKNGCAVEYGTPATHGQIAAGTYEVGIALDYVSRSLKAQGFPVGFIYPSKDLVPIASPIALVKNSANQENGKRLYDFILSEEGQRIVVENNLISVRGVGVKKIAKSSLPVDLNSLVANVRAAMETFDRIFAE